MPSALLLIWLATTPACLAADTKAKKPTFDDVMPIFRAKCNSCHNADKAKGGLNLDNFGAAMQGGASGKVIEAADVENSRLYALVTHAEEPKMPPMQPKLPDGEIETIKLWIEAGAPESGGSAVAVKAKPKFEFKLDPSAMGRPTGEPAMPAGVSLDPVVLSARPNAILAMAASPWAPLVAIGGHKQVLLYHSRERRLVGVFPFPEGTIHALKFSRNGSLLLAAGGRGGQSGGVVVFDVKDGRRAFEIVKEYDAVLAADISPDHGQIALGGPGKVVKIYSTADGMLTFELKKHTDWITALEFSPDGVLLASGDRNSGLFVWEAQTGREYFELRGSQAMISGVSWRLDSNLLASCGDDGSIRLWEMENGTQAKTWAAHGGGVGSVAFAKDGRLVSAGRDRQVRLWDANGTKQRDFEAFPDLALRGLVVDDNAVVAGDWSGSVRLFDLNDGRRLGDLSANPPALSARLARVEAERRAAEAATAAPRGDLEKLQRAASEKASLAATARQALDRDEAEAARIAAEAAAIAKAHAEATATLAASRPKLAESEAMVKSIRDAIAKARRESDEATRAIELAARLVDEDRAAIGRAVESRAAIEKSLAKSYDEAKSATGGVEADRALASLAPKAMEAIEQLGLITSASRRLADSHRKREVAIAAKAISLAATAAAEPRLKSALVEVDRLVASVEAATRQQKTITEQLVALKAKQEAASKALASSRARAIESDASKVVAEKAAIAKLNELKPGIDRLEVLRKDEAEMKRELASRPGQQASAMDVKAR